MANTFVWILAIATLITGILWVIDRFKLAPMRRARVVAAQEQSGNQIDEKLLAKIGKPASWLETSTSLFPVLAVVFIVRSFIYEPYQIPSGSMMPTLLIGDFILVEKYAYGIKNPLTQNTLIETGHPKRGDVAVFKYPLEPKLDYIKRVIGIPGDRVIYHPIDKKVSIYPSCGAERDCDKTLPITYSMGEPSDFVMTYSSQGQSSQFHQLSVNDKSVEGVRLQHFQEKLESVAHNILTNPDELTGFGYRQPGQQVGEFVVPPGHYFVLGDNRDNSADSRFWGFVPEKNLVGKATAIWMSFERQEGEWPTGVRLNRIGGIH